MLKRCCYHTVLHCLYASKVVESVNESHATKENKHILESNCGTSQTIVVPSNAISSSRRCTVAMSKKIVKEHIHSGDPAAHPSSSTFQQQHRQQLNPVDEVIACKTPINTLAQFGPLGV